MSANQKNAIPRSVFRRIVKDQLHYSHPCLEVCDGYMITKDGLAKLQQAVEEYAVEVFGGAVEEALECSGLHNGTLRRQASIVWPHTTSFNSLC